MITLKVKLVSSIKDRTIGLIGKEKPESIMFFTRFGIHTFGMKFPIDVLILNKCNRVVRLKENLKPNSLFFWQLKYNKVLELPPGEIKKLKVKLGNQIKY